MNDDTFSPNRCRRRELIAYLAGIVASDGHLKKNYHCIQIATANREFAKKLQKILSHLTNKPIKLRRNGCWVIEVSDTTLYNLLVNSFRIPPGEKSDKLIPPNISIPEEIRAFIKGFCDGDSSIHTRRMRNKKVPRIRIMSTSKTILGWIKNKDDIGCSKPFKDIPHGFGTKMNWRIEIYGNNVRKFGEKIGYLHPEKRRKLEKLLLLLENSSTPPNDGAG